MADEGTSEPDRRQGRLPVRPIVALLIALQILIPTVMLGVRHLDPSRGQMPFGWQMHTTCWGMDDPICEH